MIKQQSRLIVYLFFVIKQSTGQQTPNKKKKKHVKNSKKFQDKLMGTYLISQSRDLPLEVLHRQNLHCLNHWIPSGSSYFSFFYSSSCNKVKVIHQSLRWKNMLGVILKLWVSQGTFHQGQSAFTLLFDWKQLIVKQRQHIQCYAFHTMLESVPLCFKDLSVLYDPVDLKPIKLWLSNSIYSSNDKSAQPPSVPARTALKGRCNYP